MSHPDEHPPSLTFNCEADALVWRVNTAAAVIALVGAIDASEQQWASNAFTSAATWDHVTDNEGDEWLRLNIRFELGPDQLLEVHLTTPPKRSVCGVLAMPRERWHVAVFANEHTEVMRETMRRLRRHPNAETLSALAESAVHFGVAGVEDGCVKVMAVDVASELLRKPLPLCAGSHLEGPAMPATRSSS